MTCNCAKAIPYSTGTQIFREIYSLKISLCGAEARAVTQSSESLPCGGKFLNIEEVLPGSRVCGEPHRVLVGYEQFENRVAKKSDFHLKSCRQHPIKR